MWFNPIMIWLLRSGLHFLVSSNMIVLTYQGRKSGKRYTTPVSYVRDGQILTTTSSRERTWWRNLRGGTVVSVRLRGQDVRGESRAIEEPQEIVRRMTALLQKAPGLARAYGIQMDPGGRPDPDSLLQAAGSMVLIETHLED